MPKSFHEIAVTELTGGEWRVCVQWEQGASMQAYLPDQARARAVEAGRAGNEELARRLTRAADEAEARTRRAGATTR
jgi:hypothetical protein